jgi:NhaP-type Na+/H+ or K+/H+ antiporter
VSFPINCYAFLGFKTDQLSLIDHESFLAFGVALTFLTLGVVGILGSDDILCCFVVGNSFTWDDWFRVQSEDHSFQDVIDQLLNSVSAFPDLARHR